MIVYLSLGSNLGDRYGFLRKALELLNETPLVEVLRVSRPYETEPVGVKEQPDFLNAAAELECRIPARSLTERIKEIERLIGRSSSERWGPREIDIDIVYFGSLVLDDGTLHVPHRERAKRRFVLQPIADLAPSFVDPVLGLSVQDLLSRCPDPSRVMPSTHPLPLFVENR